MDKIIAYIDDAQHALNQLQAMATGGQTSWVLVACPPRLHRHAGRWIDHEAREAWGQQWAAALLMPLEQALRDRGDQVLGVVAHGRLSEQTQALRLAHGTARVLDARRPKFGESLEAVVAGQRPAAGSAWELPGAVATMGAVLVLALE